MVLDLGIFIVQRNKLQDKQLLVNIYRSLSVKYPNGQILEGIKTLVYIYEMQRFSIRIVLFYLENYIGTT